ncbi:MAG: hypothetical protein V3T58_05535 [Candidatus Hydrothermarchaeales archaeon]
MRRLGVMRSGNLKLVLCLVLIISLVPLVNAQGIDQEVPLDPTNIRDYCYTCHSNQPDTRLNTPPREWSKSIHAANDVTCDQCHGVFHSKLRKGLTKRQYVAVCTKCHQLDGSAAGRAEPGFYTLGTQIANPPKVSFVHGIAREGAAEPAVCVDCHGAHAITDVDDASSWVSRENIIQTCGGRGESECHASKKVADEYGISNAVESYLRNTFHGRYYQHGDKDVPTCRECHADTSSDAHNVLPSADSRSPVNPANVKKICANCHGDKMLTAKITGSMHLDLSKVPLLLSTATKKTRPYYIGPIHILTLGKLYIIQTIAIVLFIILLLNILDLSDKIGEKTRGTEEEEGEIEEGTEEGE